MTTTPPSLNPSTSNSDHQLAPVRALRGLAALMVLIYHVVIMTHFDNSPRPFIDQLRDWFSAYGSMGVETFFVLSGFVIAFSVFRKPRPTAPGDFLTKRMVRIYPPYLFYTLFAIGIYLLSTVHFGSGSVDFAYLMKSILLIPAQNAEGKFYPVLLVGWTLAFQFYFYALFALALYLKLSYQRTLVFFAIVFGCGNLLGWLAGETTAFTYLTGSHNLWYFLGGMLLFGIYQTKLLDGRNVQRGLAAGAAICVALFLFRKELSLPAALMVFITANLLVAIAVSPLLQTPRWASLLKPLAELGKASFTLYLYHWLVIAVVSGIWKRGLWAPGAEYAELTAAALVVLIAVFSLPLYHLVETRLTDPARYRIRWRMPLIAQGLGRVNR